jgi:hypothetical protein
MLGVGINLPTAVSYNFRTTKSLIARTRKHQTPSVSLCNKWRRHSLTAAEAPRRDSIQNRASRFLSASYHEPKLYTVSIVARPVQDTRIPSYWVLYMTVSRSSTVACVLIVTETCLPTCCLGTVLFWFHYSGFLALGGKQTQIQQNDLVSIAGNNMHHFSLGNRHTVTTLTG